MDHGIQPHPQLGTCTRGHQPNRHLQQGSARQPHRHFKARTPESPQAAPRRQGPHPGRIRQGENENIGGEITSCIQNKKNLFDFDE